MRRLLIVIGALGLALLLLGLSLQIVLLPAVTSAIVSRVDSAELTGLSAQRTLELAEEVRAYVTTLDAPSLPASVDHRPGFDERQASHLDDVAAVIVPSGWLTRGLFAGALVWFGIALRRPGVVRETLRSSAWIGGISLLVVVPVAAIAGLVDFDTLFAGFHGLFFAEGSWQFYSTDLIIQVFPVEFWVIAGSLWGLLAMVLAGCLALSARFLGNRGETPQE